MDCEPYFVTPACRRENRAKNIEENDMSITCTCVTYFCTAAEIVRLPQTFNNKLHTRRISKAQQMCAAVLTNINVKIICTCQLFQYHTNENQYLIFQSMLLDILRGIWGRHIKLIHQWCALSNLSPPFNRMSVLIGVYSQYYNAFDQYQVN